VDAARVPAGAAAPPFSIALSGGATPRELYRLLSGPRSGELRWETLDVFFGDERRVPFGDARSNFRMASDSLLVPARVPPERVRRMEGELPPEEAAKKYEEALRARFGETPALDLVLLGLGADGHTASLFPGTAALEETRRWVVPNEAPVEPKGRLTLTLPVLNAAKKVLFLVAGADKAQAVERALRAGDVPAARVRPAGELVWVLDESAASRL
jgi:6-phosphogluconolactonase